MCEAHEDKEEVLACSNSGVWPSECFIMFVLLPEEQQPLLFLLQSIKEQRAWEVRQWKRLNLLGKGAFFFLSFFQ